MKLLIGGSPCTHWSIAQTKNRETKPSGIGWELFLNYRIARDKYKPDFFLYENNKSMSPAIRAQITAELGVEPVLINSALVSAQNRQRLYWAGKRNPDGTYSQVAVEQPEDRGILLRDILETGVAWSEKSYCITATEAKGSNPQQTLTKHRRTMVAEPIVVNGMKNGKARTVDAHMGKLENNLVPRINNPNQAKQQYDCIAEPVRIGTIESKAKNTDFDSQQYRVYSPDGKSVTRCGNGGGVGAKTGLYAVPVAGRVVGRRINEQGHRDDYNEGIERVQRFEINEDPNKTNCLSTVEKDNMIAVPVIPDGKGQFVIKTAGGKEIPVYAVRGGRITIKGKEYPIKLADGFYIIRKLTVTECKRLQTVPEEYVFPVSATQAYKMLGNGWTVDVIAHIMSHFTGLTKEPVEVLSMYDGMSCGHIALDKLGAEITAYYATEIDKYAIQTTQHNYPDTVQLGDAFQVRDDDWRLGEEL
jgi:DNA (cytosine-5)-methyltransferase 3A